MLFFCSSCKKDQTNIPQSASIDSVSSQVPNSMVRNVKQAKNGDILIASYNAVFRYDGKSFINLTRSIKSPSFWDVLEDRKGNLWLATKNSGVYCYNGKSFVHFTTKQGLSNNRVVHIYEDKAGTIWFVTGHGLSRYDGKSFRNFTTKDGLPDNDLTTIIEDKTGKLWIGTRGDACYYNGKTFTVFRNSDGKAFHNVWSIIEDKKGTIWFGANIVEDKRGDTLFVSAGLWRYNGSTYTKVSDRGAISIIQDKAGNIWTTGVVNPPLGQDWALSRYDAKTLYNKKPTVTEIKVLPLMLCGMLQASDGSIWFGAINGVYRYDGKTVTDFKRKC